jgi:transposase InsO family protein
MPLTRPAYPSEFKAEAMRLYRTSGRSLKEIARNLGEHDLEELKRLRREVRILREKREILRKAIAFFAKKTDHIVTIYRESRGLYGVPRVQADLRSRYQIRCSKRRVSRLMRQAGLAGVNRGKKRQLSKRDASKTASPDLVERRFTATAPDRLGVADITQSPLPKAGYICLYLAVLIDLFFRKVIGWSMSGSMLSW